MLSGGWDFESNAAGSEKQMKTLCSRNWIQRDEELGEHSAVASQLLA